MTQPGARRILPAMIAAVLAQSASAADELLLYVFNDGNAVEGATVELDGQAMGTTRRDGSLFVDLEGTGQRVIAVTGPDGASQVQRFASGSGQLVDLVVDLGGDASQSATEVYSRTESAAERREAPTGTLQVTVRRGSQGASNQIVVISNGQGAVSTNANGVASKAVPRGIYTVSIGDISTQVRVAGGVTRGAVLNLPDANGIAIELPMIEEVLVLGSFDPGGFEIGRAHV